MIASRGNQAGRVPRPPSRRAPCHDRDCAAEEARWEAQLRMLARMKRQERPSPPVTAPAPVLTTLDVVDGMTRYDNLVIARALPLAVGSDAEDLACGKCGGVIASRANRETVRSRYPQGDRLLIRCSCRAINVLCGEAGRRNRLYFRQGRPLARRAPPTEA